MFVCDLPRVVFCARESLSPSLAADHSVTMEICRQAVADLHSSLRKTIVLYTAVSGRVSVVCVNRYFKRVEDLSKITGNKVRMGRRPEAHRTSSSVRFVRQD